MCEITHAWALALESGTDGEATFVKGQSPAYAPPFHVGLEERLLTSREAQPPGGGALGDAGAHC